MGGRRYFGQWSRAPQAFPGSHLTYCSKIASPWRQEILTKTPENPRSLNMCVTGPGLEEERPKRAGSNGRGERQTDCREGWQQRGDWAHIRTGAEKWGDRAGGGAMGVIEPPRSSLPLSLPFVLSFVISKQPSSLGWRPQEASHLGNETVSWRPS